MKIRLPVALVALSIGFAVPGIAQDKNTVDPEVRQEIEAVFVKLYEAYNKHDAAAIGALFRQDAIEVINGLPLGESAASGQEAIEKRYAIELATGASAEVKLVQVYPIGDEICALTESTSSTHIGHTHHVVTIFVRDADTWKIRMAYIN